jgi:hypothetical protein
MVLRELYTLRVIVAAVGISVLLAGCGSDEETITSSQDESSPTASVTGSATPSPEALSPLEGTWRTGPISPRDAEATLRQFGLAQWIEPFRPVAPFGADTVLILEIGEEWDLYGMAKAQPREEIDYNADVRVHGNKVDVIHSAGFNTFRWSVDGDTLTLEWLNTTIPSSDGIPEEVFQRALYMTEEFVMKG